MVASSMLTASAKNAIPRLDSNNSSFEVQYQYGDLSSAWPWADGGDSSALLWSNFDQEARALPPSFNGAAVNDFAGLGKAVSGLQTAMSIVVVFTFDQFTFAAPASPTSATSSAPTTTVANSSKLQADTTVKSFSITDTAANFIAGIGGLLSESKLAAVFFTDKTKPSFSLGISFFNTDLPVLAKVSSAFSLQVTGATVANAASLQSNSKVTSFTINDTAANIQGNLSALNGDSNLVSVTISDAKLINVTYQQFLSYASLVNTLGSGVLSVTGASAGAALSVGQNQHVKIEAVADTLGAITANLDNLETLAKAGKLSSIAVTDIGQTSNVTAAQYAADHDAIALMTGNFKINQTASAGLKINLIWDSNALSAPAAFRAAVQSAANILQQTFSNNITLNFNIGYGEVAGQKLTNGSAAAGPGYGNYISIAALKNDLISSSTSKDDQLAYSGLSTTLNPNGNGAIAVWSAEEKALGLISGAASSIDGYVGFATDVPAADLVGVALHELTHAMGRTSGYGPYGVEDLFRYSAPGVHSFAGGTASYLSLDNGVTHLADFATTSDFGDFSNTSSLTHEDAFNAFYDSGTSQTLSATDVRAMDVLGFTQAMASVASAGATQGAAVATPTAIAANAVGQLLAGSIT